MKIRIEVVDRNVEKAADEILEIASDLFIKYPNAEVNLQNIRNKNLAELLVKK